MSSSLFKAMVVLAIVACAVCQDDQPPVQRTFAQPDPSWNEFQIKQCCPQGWIAVGNYCAKCTPPNVFDPIDQKCRPCPADHTYSEVTQRCECFSCDLPRKMNPANNQCECPTVGEGIRMRYMEDTNECVCPEDLPLWNGKYCVKCPPGTEYDPKEKQCYHCPEGFIRDITSHACVPGL